MSTEPFIYTYGLVKLSCCVPDDWTPEQIEAFVNEEHPTGLDHGWKLAKDTHFDTGEINGSYCSLKDNPDRRHWLLTC